MFVYHVYESLTDSVWGCFHERIVCVCSGRNHFLSNQAIKWPSFCYEHFPSNRGGGGVLPGIFGGGVPPRSSNFRPKHAIFHTRFQT